MKQVYCDAEKCGEFKPPLLGSMKAKSFVSMSYQGLCSWCISVYI